MIKRTLSILLALLLSLAVLLMLGFAGAYQFLAPEIPQAAALREIKSQLPLRVLSRDGKLIAQIGEQRRIPVDYQEIPQVVVDAFLASEDDRFFEHPGVDWQGLVRAVAANVAAGGVREGGGTITMQLARNTVLSSERTLRRKLKEVFLALRLERAFSKQEILTLYLNRIFLGQRAYGIGAAAEVYFDKPVGELTLAEAALIAGLPRSPSLDNPIASVERAQARRAYVLRRMLELGKIDQAAHDAARAEPLPTRRHGPIIELEAPYLAEMARAEMVRQHADEALTGGFVVTTTVDSRLQQAANAAAWRTVLEYERRHGYRGPVERLAAGSLGDGTALAAAFSRHPRLGNLLPAVVIAVSERDATARLRDGTAVQLDWDAISWARPVLVKSIAELAPDKDVPLGPAPRAARDVLAAGDFIYLEPLPEARFRLAQPPAVAGALVALDPDDGAVIALVGGFDFGASKYNRVTQARRQPGSAFKPFLYSAALERGFTPATLVNDAPIVLPGGGGPEGGEEWRPQNITRKFYGPTPVREALVRSRNLVSIRLLRGAGIGFATRHIAGFGFGPQALPGNLTLALGTGQVTPLDMARGFAVFANGGARVTPYFIESVRDAEGREVFRAEPEVACPQCGMAAADVAMPTDRPDDAAASQAEVEPGADEAVPGQQAVPAARRAPQAISPANAFVMTDMMVDVVQRGTAQRAATELGRRDIAGKTGTTSDRRDTWFVGYNADVAAAAWIGFDQERTLGENEEGGRTALPMWIAFMKEALRDRPEHRQPEPPGVVRMWVSRSSGTPTRAGASGALFEAFLEQYAPQPGATYGGGDEAVGAETIESSSDDSLF